MAKGKRGKQKENRRRQETFRQQEDRARSAGDGESSADLPEDSRKKRQPKFGHN